METNIKAVTENHIKRIANFLKVKLPECKTNNEKDIIKKLCVLRLCKSIGLNTNFNYSSNFFKVFSSIAGEAVCQTLNINIQIAEDEIRLFKYDSINLVEKFKEYLAYNDIDEGFIDGFLFLERNNAFLKLIQ